MAMTSAQQLEYDVFIRNNPGDEHRAAEALGYDTRGGSASNPSSGEDLNQGSRDDPTYNPRDQITGRDAGSWEAALRAESARKGVQYDPTMLGDVVRQVSYAQNSGKDPAIFLQNAFRTIAERSNNTPGVVPASAAAPATSGAGAVGGGNGGGGGSASGGSSYGAMMSGYGAAPEPFGETYTPLARPSYLQGEYVPGQWSEQYAQPTMADLQADPGYLSSESAMQRGMERSAAAKGTVLSGGFVGRALPRALGEHASTAFENLNTRTFDQYRQKYGQFTDAEGLKLGARNVNESAFQGDQGTNLAGYNTRYAQYLDTAGLKRQSENDIWSRNRDTADLSLRAAALARPY